MIDKYIYTSTQLIKDCKYETYNSINQIYPGISFNVTNINGLWNDEYGYGLLDAYNSVINTPSTIYIQNDTIDGTRLISADSIIVGRDVTDEIEQGDVIIGQGNITLKANYIELKNSTLVPIGTTLKTE